MSVMWKKADRDAIREELSRLGDEFPFIKKHMRHLLRESARCDTCNGCGTKRVGDDYRGYDYVTCWACKGEGEIE